MTKRPTKKLTDAQLAQMIIIRDTPAAIAARRLAGITK
ncbi:hypothetical protein LAL4801_04165 [Roseibium aggregatum]|uniref:Uncharacterized protein n=1 Tax=Roseibium aggregatum TaxID=187304 RepID=A0A0M6YA76_9HYPH|nr:hypothetical protein LAL4801_04165 [Roseibium aggregatum]